MKTKLFSSLLVSILMFTSIPVNITSITTMAATDPFGPTASLRGYKYNEGITDYFKQIVNVGGTAVTDPLFMFDDNLTTPGIVSSNGTIWDFEKPMELEGFYINAPLAANGNFSLALRTTSGAWYTFPINGTGYYDLRQKTEIQGKKIDRFYIKNLVDKNFAINEIEFFGKKVNIPDPALLSSLNEILGRGPTTEITEELMTRFQNLPLYSRGITDLTGLEFATNLKDVNLYNNLISDLTPLKNSIGSLTKLNVSQNILVDKTQLDPFRYLGSNLTFSANFLEGEADQYTFEFQSEVLGIANQQTKTVRINWFRNGVPSAIPVQVTNPQVRVIDGPFSVANPTGNTFQITATGEGSGNVEFEPIKGFKKQLPVITDIVYIPDDNLKKALNELLGRGSTTEDIPKIDMLSLPSYLPLYSKGITNITGLEYATNTTKINLYNNNVQDFSPLSNLTSLTELDIGRNNISDISSLSNLTNLTKLSLSTNNISDISPLSNLTKLTDLNLSVNNISDVSSLKNISTLTNLNISNNSIIDKNQIQQLNITNINFDHNYAEGLDNQRTFTLPSETITLTKGESYTIPISWYFNNTKMDGVSYAKQNVARSVNGLTTINNVSDSEIQITAVTEGTDYIEYEPVPGYKKQVQINIVPENQFSLELSSSSIDFGQITLTGKKQTIRTKFPSITVINTFDDGSEWEVSVTASPFSDKVSPFRLVDNQNNTILLDQEGKTIITNNASGIFTYDFDVEFDIPPTFKFSQSQQNEELSTTFTITLSKTTGP